MIDIRTMPIKIVHMSKSVQRRKIMDKLIQDQQLKNVEFIEAVDGIKDYDPKFPSTCRKHRSLKDKQGIYGCNRSHYKLLDKLENDPDNDYYLIFEDDIYFTMSADEINVRLNKYLLPRINDFAVFYLGCQLCYLKTDFKKSLIIEDTFSYALQPSQTHAYIISKKYVKLIKPLLNTGCSPDFAFIKFSKTHYKQMFYFTDNPIKQLSAKLSGGSYVDERKNPQK